MDYIKQVAVADIKYYAKNYVIITKCRLILEQLHKYGAPSEDCTTDEYYSVEMVNQNSSLKIIPFRPSTPKMILLRITINI